MLPKNTLAQHETEKNVIEWSIPLWPKTNSIKLIICWFISCRWRASLQVISTFLSPYKKNQKIGLTLMADTPRHLLAMCPSMSASTSHLECSFCTKNVQFLFMIILECLVSGKIHSRMKSCITCLYILVSFVFGKCVSVVIRLLTLSCSL